MMGASSGHVRGVNVLLFDGSVRTVTPGIDLAVWKSLATTQSASPGGAAVSERAR
jgi:prepilin-type processing-associated H-X9-DG protein